jgi:hypothetical protein
VPKTLEELRTQTQYQLAIRSPCLPRPPTQKIVNRLLAETLRKTKSPDQWSFTDYARYRHGLGMWRKLLLLHVLYDQMAKFDRFSAYAGVAAFVTEYMQMDRIDALFPRPHFL